MCTRVPKGTDATLERKCMCVCLQASVLDDVVDFSLVDVVYFEVIHVPSDGHLFAGDGLVHDARVVWVCDKIQFFRQELGKFLPKTGERPEEFHKVLCQVLHIYHVCFLRR